MGRRRTVIGCGIVLRAHHFHSAMVRSGGRSVVAMECRCPILRMVSARSAWHPGRAQRCLKRRREEQQKHHRSAEHTHSNSPADVTRSRPDRAVSQRFLRKTHNPASANNGRRHASLALAARRHRSISRYAPGMTNIDKSGAVIMPPTIGSPCAGSFDHLVSAQQQRLRHFQSQQLRRLHVYDQLKLQRLLHGHVGRLCAFQDAVHVTCYAA